MRKLVLVGIGLWAAGCWTQESVKILPGKGIIAVGAKIDLVVLDGCSQNDFDVNMAGGGKLPTKIDFEWPTCARTEIETFHSLDWSDGAIFKVENQRLEQGTFFLTVTAQKAGTSALAVTVDTTRTSELLVEGDYEARVAQRVELKPVCSGQPGSWLLPPSQQIDVDFTLFDEHKQALTGYGFYPFEVSTLKRIKGDGRRVTYETPAATGPFTVTSSLDSTLKLSGAVVTVTSFDAMKLGLSDKTPYVGASTEVRLSPQLLGQGPCVDPYERVFTVKTPTICSLSSTAAVTTQTVTAKVGAVVVTGTAEGKCIVTGTLVGSSVSGELEIDFAAKPGVLDPARWKQQDLSAFSSPSLRRVWGLSATEVYLAGSKSVSGASQPLLLRFDGSSWQELQTGAKASVLTAVWGSSASDLFVAALELTPTDAGTKEQASLYHFDGSSWQQMQTPGACSTIHSIWGSSANDVYAVGLLRGQSGTFWHYDGSTWSELTTPKSGNQSTFAQQVWGSGASDVYIIGRGYQRNASGDFLLHGSGSSWKDEMSGTPRRLGAIWGYAADDLYLSATSTTSGSAPGEMLHFDGSTWLALPSFSATHAPLHLWGSAPGSLLAAGERGRLNYYDGNKWSATAIGAKDFQGLWGSGAADIWLLTRDELLRFQ